MMNQPESGETEGPAAETDMLLMQMTLEPRNQQDSQKQPSLMATENTVDSTNAYERREKEAGKELWENTRKKLALNSAPKQISNIS